LGFFYKYTGEIAACPPCYMLAAIPAGDGVLSSTPTGNVPAGPAMTLQLILLVMVSLFYSYTGDVPSACSCL
jgi:hypothetical protein